LELLYSRHLDDAQQRVWQLLLEVVVVGAAKDELGLVPRGAHAAAMERRSDLVSRGIEDSGPYVAAAIDARGQRMSFKAEADRVECTLMSDDEAVLTLLITIDGGGSLFIGPK